MDTVTHLAHGGTALPPGPPQTRPAIADTDPLDFALLNDFQRGFPLVAEPWAALGVHLGCSADEVLARLTRLRDGGKISRVGPVFAPNRIGASTLAAMAVPSLVLKCRVFSPTRVTSAIGTLNNRFASLVRRSKRSLVPVSSNPDSRNDARRFSSSKGIAGVFIKCLSR